MPYKIVKGDNGDAWVQAGGKDYSPSQISAFILQKMKETAEAYLGETVTQAVITVPAYFNDAQRQATKDAGQIAGLEVLRIINEPTAAALAYGLDKEDGKTIAVYDLGGGTFDVSVLEIGDGVFEVKSTNGDTFLGGEDFDAAHRQLARRQVQGEGRHRPSHRPARAAAAQGSRRKGEDRAVVGGDDRDQPAVHHRAHGRRRDDAAAPGRDADPRRARKAGRRPDRTHHGADARRRSRTPGIDAKDIADVVLVGGMTRMPRVRERVKEFFGREPHTGVNPDEVVAMGAAIQAGVLQGDVKDVLLLDVTPLSLGIETLGGVFTRMIDRNTTIPTKKSQVFSTAEDNQNAVTIRVFQGEREMAADNKVLGQFDLVGIPPAPRGVPQIEVTFDIDANGIVNVSRPRTRAPARSSRSASRLRAGSTIPTSRRWSRKPSSSPTKTRSGARAAEAKNNAESLIHSTEKQLAEHGDKVSAEVKEEIEKALAEAKTAVESGDADDMQQKTAALTQAAMKLGQAMYEAAAGRRPKQPAEAGRRRRQARRTEQPARGRGCRRGILRGRRGREQGLMIRARFLPGSRARPVRRSGEH